MKNKRIQVKVEVSDYVSGTFRISTADRQDGLDIRVSGNGIHTFNYVSLVNRVSLQPQLFIGSIDNVSVKEVDPNERWTLNPLGSSELSLQDGSVTISTSGDYVDFKQLNILTSSRKYRLSYDVLDTDNGNLGLIIEGNNTMLIPSSLGNHTVEFISHNESLIIKRYSGALDITLDNISILTTSSSYNF